MVRGQLPGLRDRQDAPAGYGFGDPASDQVQEIQSVAYVSFDQATFSVMPGTQSSLRRLRKLVCAAGHPRLFRTDERKTWMAGTLARSRASIARRRRALTPFWTRYARA